ncbi:MAG TPA: hypothetical protein VKP65_24070 [Rhodothermales bacterium]|nr:hypothetical protein [Rhodothermales bacterium]
MENYVGLAAGYGVALGLWLFASRLLPGLWPATQPATFQHPWREVGWVLLACLGVIGLGQLWSAGIRLPIQGPAGPLLEAINQVLIFAPLLGLLALRRQPLSTAWLPTHRIGTRLLLGLALALVALTIYLTVTDRLDTWLNTLARTYHPRQFGRMVQIFLEDILIAMLAVRFRAALGTTATVIIVAALFAAGHIPAYLAQGASFSELGSLVLDTALGIGILFGLLHGRDIWWFWVVHMTLDLVQLVGPTS